MTALVFIDTSSGIAHPDSLGILGALARLGAAPHALVLGESDDDNEATLAAHGAAAITTFVGDAGRSGAEALAAAVIQLAGEQPAGRWFASTTTVTTEAAAIIAARLDVGLWWRLVDIDLGDDGELVGTQLAADAASTTRVSWATPWGVGLIRAHAFGPEPVVDTRAISVERRQLPAVSERAPDVIERRPADSGSSGLLDADVIVAAGRGVGSADRLDLVRELAELLDGAAGVSLPLVEAGWAPRSMQVGQTGTTVAPRLYVACGISGQIQHRVGMERSQSIIAINTDPNAPIMSFCDLAVVADVGDVLPDLIAALRGG